jgi:UDP-glucose 4-epimerase
VTGVTGFLGRHLSRALSRDGFRVVGIGPGRWTEDDQRAWGVEEWHDVDLSATLLRELAPAPDVVFHCAGAGSVGGVEANPADDRRRSIGSAALLAEYLRGRRAAGRAVFVSSAAVYGSTPEPAAEDAPLRPASAYARHKAEAERLFLERASDEGPHVAIVRLTSVYGPGLRKQLLWDACGKLIRDDAVFCGTGSEQRDWLHVDDAIRLLRLAAERASPHPIVVNGGSSAAVAVSDLLAAVAAALGSDRRFAFSGVSRPGDPEKILVDVARSHSWGWEARTSWREGVREYCAWYRRTVA